MPLENSDSSKKTISDPPPDKSPIIGWELFLRRTVLAASIIQKAFLSRRIRPRNAGVLVLLLLTVGHFSFGRSNQEPSEDQRRLINNHHGDFFVDPPPGKWKLDHDEGSWRDYSLENFRRVRITIQEHDPAQQVVQGSPSTKDSRASSATGTFREYSYFATWVNDVSIDLKVGLRYTVSFKFTTFLRSDEQSRFEADPAGTINRMLEEVTVLIDLPRLAKDSGWKSAKAQIIPDFLKRLPPNPDPTKPTSLDTVLSVLADQPDKVKEWAKTFYHWGQTNTGIRNTCDIG
jgi:hypothetical protein